jgi:UDP-glucose 4-epimerase
MAELGRVAVTGAAGYVGRHFLRRCAAAGEPAVAVVRSPISLPDADDVRVADVLDLDGLCRAFTGCETIVHLACLPVARCQTDPVTGFRVNALGTAHVLEAARRAEVRRAVYASSAQVYGRPEVQPVAESTPCRPVTPYGASKLCGEVLCQTAARAQAMEMVILRLFNVYGLAADGAPRPTVETLFLRAVQAGQAPVVSGHPGHVRDFVHVTDVVEVLERALTTGRADGHPMNVGTGRGTSLEELAWLAIRLLGRDIVPRIEPPSELPIMLEADINRARQWLGWTPTVSLEEGLAVLAGALRA